MQHEANGTLEQMPYLVYWFDASSPLQKGAAAAAAAAHSCTTMTLEPRDSIVSYERGEQLQYDQVPKEIVKKLMAHASLTASERVLCDALTALENARVSGAPPVAVMVPPEDKLYQIVSARELLLLQTTSDNNNNNSVHKPTEVAASSSTSNGVERRDQPPPQPGMPKIGDRVKVYFAGGTDDVFHHGCVQEVRGDFYFLIYDDEETQWLPLADYRFELLLPSHRPVTAADTAAAAAGSNRKRKAAVHGSPSLVPNDDEL